MSRIQKHRLTCPKCGAEKDTVVYDSVNVTLDPTLREKLVNGEINVFACGKCGNKAFIQTPLLYHDMKREYCVQYYPPQAIEGSDFLKQFTQDGCLNMAGLPAKLPGGYLATPHIVFDLNEMLRYVEFRDRVYDQNK